MALYIFQLYIYNPVTCYKKIYTIGSPVKEKPVKLKLHNKSIEYKLALFSDFYFGKGWTDGEITVEGGNLSEILDICLKNIGRKDISKFSKTINHISFFLFSNVDVLIFVNLTQLKYLLFSLQSESVS